MAVFENKNARRISKAAEGVATDQVRRRRPHAREVQRVAHVPVGARAQGAAGRAVPQQVAVELAAGAEAGDILIPIAEGAFSQEQIAGALGEVVNGDVAGRTSNDEITVFKSVGLAMQDAVTAARLYAKAITLGIGSQVHL